VTRDAKDARERTHARRFQTTLRQRRRSSECHSESRGRDLTRPSHRFRVTAANSRSVWTPRPPVGWLRWQVSWLAGRYLRPAFPVSQWL